MKSLTYPLKQVEVISKTAEKLNKETGVQLLTGCIDSQKTHLAYMIGESFKKKLIVTYSELKAKEIFEEYKVFGQNVYLYPAKDLDVEYVPLEELFKRSDVISLHCPLTPQTKHILNKESFSMMKKGVYIINTSRGELIESQALLDSLSSEKVGGAGLDVYEEESDLFFEDFSFEIIKDDILSILVSRPNVIITSHQAFFTKEALENIAKTTFENLDEYFSGRELTNEVCYRCDSGKLIENCKKSKAKKCF